MSSPQYLLKAIPFALAGVLFSGATFAADAPLPAHLTKLDPDSDHTVDLAEAKKAAETKFDALDPDKDGTLDTKEAAKAGVTAADLKKGDPDNDKTLDKDEYLTLVEAAFKAADPDNDGTVSAVEFKTKAGKKLLKLIS